MHAALYQGLVTTNNSSSGKIHNLRCGVLNVFHSE
jgi:hypothetical protein